MTKLRSFQNARDVLRHAYANAPSFIGYMHNPAGWVIYSPVDPPKGIEPELFVPARGRLPVALSDNGSEVFASILLAAIRDLA